MSYQPKEWNSKTPITVDNLNHIEGGIAEAHSAIEETGSRVEQIANNQIPEEYLQESVNQFIEENEAGLATKTELSALNSQLSSEIATYHQLSEDILAVNPWGVKISVGSVANGAIKLSGNNGFTIPSGSTGANSYVYTTVYNSKVAQFKGITKNKICLIRQYYEKTGNAPIDFEKAFSFFAQIVDENGNATYHSAITDKVVTVTDSYIDILYTNLPDNIEQVKIIVQAKDCGAYTEDFTILFKDNMITNYLKKESFVMNRIVIKTDGSGDETSIVRAIQNIKDSSKDNIYNIEIHEGTYDITYQLGGKEYYKNWTSNNYDYGLTLPPHVNLIGVGSREKIKLVGKVTPNDANNLTDAEKLAMRYIATINIRHDGNTLKNLTVTAQNIRYACHDESSNAIKDWTHHIVNCYMEHLGNIVGAYEAPCAYGCGMSSGSELYFKDSAFYGAGGNAGIFIHDNANFEKGCVVHIDNCISVSKENTHEAAGIEFVTTGEGTEQNYAYINNTIFNGIRNGEGVAISANGGDSRWTIQGGGNSKNVRYKNQMSTSDKKAKIIFADECLFLQNTSGATIAKGTPVKIVGNSFVAMSADDEMYLFEGIAIEDIPNGEVGYIKNSGWVGFWEMNLWTCDSGDKVGIVNGAFSKVEGTEYIGIATNNKGFIIRK